MNTPKYKMYDAPPSESGDTDWKSALRRAAAALNTVRWLHAASKSKKKVFGETGKTCEGKNPLHRRSPVMRENSFGGLLGRGHRTLRLWPWQRVQRRAVPDGMVYLVLQPGAPLLEFFDFLVGREIDFLFDAVDGFVQRMVLIKHFPEVDISGFEQPNGITMFREFSEDRMMEVYSSTHSTVLLFRLVESWDNHIPN